MRAADARYRPHDLLRVARVAPCGDEPEWVRGALARASWVVVRRAQANQNGRVAVGIRGTERAQRFGAWIDDQDVESIVSPEDLVRVAPAYTRGALPAFVALAALRVRLDGFSWGPTGSAGFELATGVPTVRASSDLDVLIRVSARPAQAVIRSLADTVFNAASEAGTRIDAQIETPAGGVALAELVEGKARVLARANDGPRLVADPWGI